MSVNNFDDYPVDDRVRPWDEFIYDSGKTYVIDSHGSEIIEIDGQFFHVREIKSDRYGK